MYHVGFAPLGSASTVTWQQCMPITTGSGFVHLGWSGSGSVRSVWIMVHQRNRRIHSGHGFTGSFDASWFRLILDYWTWSRSPQRNASLVSSLKIIRTNTCEKRVTCLELSFKYLKNVLISASNTQIELQRLIQNFLFIRQFAIHASNLKSQFPSNSFGQSLVTGIYANTL